MIAYKMFILKIHFKVCMIIIIIIITFPFLFVGIFLNRLADGKNELSQEMCQGLYDCRVKLTRFAFSRFCRYRIIKNSSGKSILEPLVFLPFNERDALHHFMFYKTLPFKKRLLNVLKRNKFCLNGMYGKYSTTKIEIIRNILYRFQKKLPFKKRFGRFSFWCSSENEFYFIS